MVSCEVIRTYSPYVAMAIISRCRVIVFQSESQGEPVTHLSTMAQVTFIVHTIHLPQSVGGEVS